MSAVAYSMMAQDAPYACEPVLDLVHLARQSLGDRDLELELLGLFRNQALSLVARLQGPSIQEGRARADLAHLLKGSARAIGAARTARAAEALEAALKAQASSPETAVESLAACVREVCAEIDALRA